MVCQERKLQSQLQPDAIGGSLKKIGPLQTTHRATELGATLSCFMTHCRYDFFIAGRWRNAPNIKPVLDTVRAHGQSAYCFIENDYKGEVVELGLHNDPHEFMAKLESLPQEHPLVQKIFQTDMEAQRDSERFLVVLPAGIAAHIEAGVAYGMGKKCYAIGKLEKLETLYCIFDRIFPTAAEFTVWLQEQSVVSEKS